MTRTQSPPRQITSAAKFAAHHSGAAPEANRARRGTILVVAILCFVVTATLIGSALSLVQTQRRQMMQHQARQQAEWLAQSGCDRAAARLRHDPEYRGEIWSLAPADLGGSDAGQVTIHVEPVANRPEARLIRAEAVYPSDSVPAVRRTREFIVVLIEEL